MEYDHAPVLAFCVLGGRYGTPSPDRDVAAIRGLAVRHPIPPTPRPYGLLPNLSGSSGTPGENLARGSFLWPGPARKSPAKGGAKVWLQTLVASDTGRAGRGKSPGPWLGPLLVDARASSPTSTPFAARRRQQTSRMLKRAPKRSRAPLRPRAFSGRLQRKCHVRDCR